MMDRLTSMAVFVCVAEKGGFAAAARALRLSPTMIGKHIRFLEQRLGTRLLQRTTRRQHLTEAGALFLESSQQLLSDAADAETGVHRLQRAPRGLLRVGSPVTFGSQRLASAIATFLLRYPHVRVELILQDQPIDLLEDGVDVAFRIGHLKDSSLVARRLQPYRMLLCASPGYLARHGTPKTPADLARHNCLGFAHWDRPDAWRLLGPNETAARAGKKLAGHTVAVAGNFVANHGVALRAAALAGLGVVLQPEALLADDVAARRLVRLLPNHEPPSRPMHLVYLADRQMTPKLRAFVDFAVRQFA